MRQFRPMIDMDYPDPDVIRVDDTYYMISTTMHFFPGGVILRSYDLMHWEIASYVFDRLESTPAQTLAGEQSIYGKGMWAASLRYHRHRFYVLFSAWDTGKTYCYTADEAAGPWERSCLKGVHHHSSILFDGDGRVFVTWGMNEIRLTEMTSDLSGIQEGGIERVLVKDEKDADGGFENSHFYKKDGTYYLFTTHWSKKKGAHRTQMCFWADSPEGEFTGVTVFDDVPGQKGQGISQGGIVDTPDGGWYSVMVWDCGAAGRLPVLVPVSWEGKRPVFGEAGKMPESVAAADGRPGYQYAPLYSGAIFSGETDEEGKPGIGAQWQWNHEPKSGLWRRTDDGGLAVKTGKISVNVTQAANMLTQRIRYPRCSMEVSLDVTDLMTGDCAGLCVLQGCYGWIGIMRDIGRYFLVVQCRKPENALSRELTADYLPGTELVRIPIRENVVRLKADVDFTDSEETVCFFFRRSGKWVRVAAHGLPEKRDHMMGCRFGLFAYSARKAGGEAVFYDVSYHEETMSGPR